MSHARPGQRSSIDQNFDLDLDVDLDLDRRPVCDGLKMAAWKGRPR
jgi:hypothetical protein